MVIRKIFGYFLVFLFILVSLPAFLTYSLSKTFLNPSFYSDSVIGVFYDFALNVTTKNLYQQDPTLRRHFQEEELLKEIQAAFPVGQFHKIMADFGQQLEELKNHPEKTVTFNFKLLRTSLVAVAQHMSSKLFSSLPDCHPDELPQFNEEGLATCIPKGVDSNLVAGPVAKQFEKAIYDTIPDQVDLSFSKADNNLSMASFLQWIDIIKTALFGTLLALIILIVFVIYKPFSAILRFEGKAFLGSGLEGFLLSLVLVEFPKSVFSIFSAKSDALIQTLGGKETLLKFFEYLFSFFIVEIQRISLVFLGLGAFLLFIYFYLKRKNTLALKT